MKVAFMQGLPPDQQEKLFEIWLRLRRDPTGGYTGAVIAEAIIERITREARAVATAEDDEAAWPQWYRRYRLNPRVKARSRSTGISREALRRAIRKSSAAA